MLRRFGYILALIASIQIVGGHWAVLQSVAWVGMIADYSQTYGMTHGLSHTFDGEHPCPLCQKVALGRQSEQKQAPQDFDLKLAKQPTLSPEKFAAIFREGPVAEAVWFGTDRALSARREAPPTPPPRLASV